MLEIREQLSIFCVHKTKHLEIQKSSPTEVGELISSK